MKNIFFDICSIPLFLIILWICYSRKMLKGNVNQMFIIMTLFSLVCAAADLGMELVLCDPPLSAGAVALGTALSYTYKFLRNVTLAMFFLFILALTRTTSLFSKKWIKLLFALPFAVTLLTLVQNFFTHNVFSVTAAEGYSRGPWIIVLYIMAALYGVSGLIYCIHCRRYLPTGKWSALIGMYVLAFAAVILQYFRGDLLVEMFFTAVGEMLVMLAVMRPEERMDSEVGMQSWDTYRSDLRNILISGERVQIIVIRMLNCREIRTYLGDHKYNAYLSEIAKEILALDWKRHHRVSIYFERPGTIYLIVDESETGTDEIGLRLLSETGERIRGYADMGVRFEPRLCLIRVPDDLTKLEDIVNLGHKFPRIDKRKQLFCRAEDLVHSRTFAVETHMEEILKRTITDKRLEMYYQPIYDVQTGGFRSAEALARLRDPVYGDISPADFIPAAETMGLILPLGDLVLDSVFRFVSEHDLKALGLDYIELNLSVAQCMQSNLPETIRRLQERYHVDPGQINMEITETTFENISEVMVRNVEELIGMGYSFALDDYGIGYSSIQRVNHLPLELIKIDKSMLDEIVSEKGRRILQHTILMMQSIDKRIVVEGAETRSAVDALEKMHCDYIQGYFFSKPLPEEDFIRFIEAHRT